MNPNEDGVTHINIYSRSLCRLGCFLSHFPRTPFVHPLYGNFESMEGFWYYAKTGFKHELLRGLYGFEAKSFGKKLDIVKRDDFLEIIKEANRVKLKTFPLMELALKNTNLPLTHYYVFGTWEINNKVRQWHPGAVIREAKDSQWLLDFWNEERAKLKEK